LHKFVLDGNYLFLRRTLQNGIICIPKSVSEERVKENSNVFDFEISQDDMKELNSMDNGYFYFLFNLDFYVIKNGNMIKLNKVFLYKSFHKFVFIFFKPKYFSIQLF
jgi:hypothetical protein